MTIKSVITHDCSATQLGMHETSIKVRLASFVKARPSSFIFAQDDIYCKRPSRTWNMAFSSSSSTESRCRSASPLTPSLRSLSEALVAAAACTSARAFSASFAAMS